MSTIAAMLLIAKKLGLNKIKLEGYSWPPTIKVTPTFFEAILQSRDGKEQWHISNDGKTWKQIITTVNTKKDVFVRSEAT